MYPVYYFYLVRPYLGGAKFESDTIWYGTRERWWGTAHERDGGTFETGLSDIAFSLTEFQVQIERNIELIVEHAQKKKTLEKVFRHRKHDSSNMSGMMLTRN